VIHLGVPLFLNVDFRKAMLSVAIVGHFLQSMMRTEAENDIEDGFFRTSNGGLSRR
jgi:hypothetical protein